MPTYQITAPNGRTYKVDGPAGATDDEVRGEVLRQHPDAAPNAESKAKPRDTSAARGFALGLIKPLDNLSRAIGAGQTALGDVKGGAATEAAYQRNQADRADNTRTGFQTAGNIVGTLPTAAVPGGVLAQGAVGGLALTDADTAGGAAVDAAVGAGGGAVSRGLIQRGARSLRLGANVAPSVRRLLDEGVKLTPGQIMGAGGSYVGQLMKSAEDKIAGTIPILGKAIDGARARGVESLNRAAINRSLKPIGEALPDNVQIGTDAVAYAGDRLRAAYNDVLPKISGAIDKTFAKRVKVIGARAALPDAQKAEFDEIVKNELINAFDKTGKFTGRNLQRASDRLDKLASAYSTNTQNPYARVLGDAVTELREQLHSLARRSNPAEATRLRAIDTGYANVIRVERAALNTTDGVFAPGQLAAGVRQSDRSIRKRAVSRGEALMQDLSNDARSIMPSATGNTGTADRAVMAAVLSGGAGVAGGVPGLAAAAAGLGAASLPYTKFGARVVSPLMTRQAGPKSQYVAGLIGKSAAPVSLAAPALLRRPE